jgi:fructoselysine 3-epimerase
MKFSIATSVFVNYPLPDTLDLIIQAGFTGIDLWCGRPHLYRRDYSDEQIRALRRKLVDADVAPVSLMPAFFRYPYSLSSPSDVIRQDSIQYVKETILNAAQMGARHVLIVPTRRLHGQTTEDARARFYDSLRQLCPLAQEANMLLGIEILYPSLSDYMCSSADALSAFQEVGSPSLKAVLDTGHLHLSGESLEHALAALGSSVIQVHVNDNDGLQQQNGVPGTGSYPFGGLKETLERAGYDDFLTIELGWQYSFDPYPAVCDALQRMRAYLHLDGRENHAPHPR